MDPLDKPRRIFPNFYLGNFKSSQDRYVLYDFNISHILTVGVGMPAKFPDYFKYMVLDDVLDMDHQNIRKYFRDAYEFIETGRNKGTGVLVHCMSGVSRGPSFCAMYLMAKLQVSLEDALDLVRYASPQLSPNDGFMSQLRNFEKRVRKMTNITENDSSGSVNNNNGSVENKAESSDVKSNSNNNNNNNDNNKSELTTTVNTEKSVVNSESESVTKPEVEGEILTENIADQGDSTQSLQTLVSELSLETSILVQTTTTTTTTTTQTSTPSSSSSTHTHTNTFIDTNVDNINSLDDGKNVQITNDSNDNNSTSGFPEPQGFRYCCRKCGRTVFTSEEILEHRTGRGQDMFQWNKRMHNSSKVPECTSYFLNQAEWMGELNQMHGRLDCPNIKCGQRIGSYKWDGLQCSCGRWITPSFQIPKSRVDEKRLSQTTT